MFATVGSHLLCSFLVGVWICGSPERPLRLDTKDQQCLALILLINHWWELEQKWFSFALSARLHLPSWFWWLLILLMVVNVIKNEWKRGRVSDSRAWPRASRSSRYPSIFLHRKYLPGSQVPISSSLCFLQHVCFVCSPNSHFWQPTTLLLLQRLLRLNSEIKSKSGKPWLHWNVQDENELAKLLKKSRMLWFLFVERLTVLSPFSNLGFTIQTSWCWAHKFRNPLRRLWLQRHLKTPCFSLVQREL